jgi:hypothetical protein
MKSQPGPSREKNERQVKIVLNNQKHCGNINEKQNDILSMNLSDTEI